MCSYFVSMTNEMTTPLSFASNFDKKKLDYYWLNYSGYREKQYEKYLEIISSKDKDLKESNFDFNGITNSN